MAHAGRVHLVGRLVGCLRATRKGRETGVTELNAKRSDLPDISTSGLNDSAKMVWQAIQARPRFNRDSTPGKFRDLPGWYWQGAVNEVVNSLWPSLNDRYMSEKEEAELMKLALNRFLRYNKAVVCTRDGGLTKPSLWFVARHWPELTVTPGVKAEDISVVTDEAATAAPSTAVTVATPLDVFKLSRPPVPAVAAPQEERSEEEMTPTFQEPVTEAAVEDDDVVYHDCRLDGCEEKFEGVHHRATHEMKHGFRYNNDGTVTNFDPSDPVPDEEAVQTLIARVAAANAESMNQSEIVEAVRKLSPKAASPTIKIVLEVMTDEKWFNVVTTVPGQKGRVRRYEYLGEPMRKAKKKAVAKPLAVAVEEKADALVSQDDAGFMETAVATLRGETDGTRLERYQSLFGDLVADLKLLNEQTAEIKRLKDANADLQRNLDAVINQRDELQGKLDTLKQVFGSALQ